MVFVGGRRLHRGARSIVIVIVAIHNDPRGAIHSTGWRVISAIRS